MLFGVIFLITIFEGKFQGAWLNCPVYPHMIYSMFLPASSEKWNLSLTEKKCGLNDMIFL